MSTIKQRKNLSIILKLIIIISAVIGTFLSAHSGRGAFMAGPKVFMYFTIQSNIAIAIICAIGGYFILRNRGVSDTWYTVKFVGTVAITLTGVVFVLVLAPTLGKNAWNVHNVLTHVVVPIASVIDFFVIVESTAIKRKNVFYVIIPPLLYAVYAGIGYISGWEFSDGKNYPYFFLNWGSPAGAFGFSSELPFIGTGWWILTLFIFLIIVGSCYMEIAENIRKKQNGDIDDD